MKYDLVTFGECMVRLTAPGNMRLEQTTSLNLSVGGAEWTVACNVSRLGCKTAWLSRLVDNWAGRQIINQACMHGVDTSLVVMEEFDGVGLLRNGFYHVEVGVGPRSSSVTYDRGHTAIATMTYDMVDWNSVLSGTRWLHISGITPALSEELGDICIKLFKQAAELGVTASYDLNFRSKLWTSHQAQAINKKIVPYVKVLIGNEEDFEKCLGYKIPAGDSDYSKLDPTGYMQMVEKVRKDYPNIEIVGTTLREAKTGRLNNWCVLVQDGRKSYLSRTYENLEIVDRVGGGDSFASAVIYGLLNDWPTERICEFAGAYSALAHTFPGDVNWAAIDEVENVMQGKSARISR
ncbi:MAG: sugar kinase [Planctomycetota bacterium]